MVLIASERTIAAAAHAADFADAAHLTRTFYQMIGMAPSVLMREDFVEIPSPFTGAGDAGPHEPVHVDQRHFMTSSKPVIGDVLFPP